VHGSKDYGLDFLSFSVSVNGRPLVLRINVAADFPLRYLLKPISHSNLPNRLSFPPSANSYMFEYNMVAYTVLAIYDKYGFLDGSVAAQFGIIMTAKIFDNSTLLKTDDSYSRKKSVVQTGRRRFP
jgi:hypothetical protein